MGFVLFSFFYLLAFAAEIHAQSTNYNFVCTFVDQLSCDNAVAKPVCTTDGRIYASECLFTRAHCKDVTLTPVDCKAATIITLPTPTNVSNITTADPATVLTTTDGITADPGMNSTLTTTDGITADPGMNSTLTTGDQLTNTTAPVTTLGTTRNVDIVCQALLSNPCPADDSRVCASNLVAYENLCEYTKARCLDPGLTVLASGSCAGITTPAPDVAKIVCNALAASSCYDDGIVLCGSDDITYGNSCLFEKNKCQKLTLTVKHVGTCGE